MSLPTQQRLNDHLVRWDRVVGYEGRYEVSDDGRVRSLPNRTRSGTRELVLSKDTGGYSIVSLCLDGKKSTHLVHRLVARAFLGAPPDGYEVCHQNAVKNDNRVENLRWDTRSANQLDVVAHGHHPMASRSSCPAGHPRTPENTYRRPDGRTYCRPCHRERSTR